MILNVWKGENGFGGNFAVKRHNGSLFHFNITKPVEIIP